MVGSFLSPVSNTTISLTLSNRVVEPVIWDVKVEFGMVTPVKEGKWTGTSKTLDRRTRHLLGALVDLLNRFQAQ